MDHLGIADELGEAIFAESPPRESRPKCGEADLGFIGGKGKHDSLLVIQTMVSLWALISQGIRVVAQIAANSPCVDRPGREEVDPGFVKGEGKYASLSVALPCY